MSGFDLRSLLATLDQHSVRFIIIGGVAVGAHGYVRATEDLDIVPDPEPANIDRLIEALTSLEASLPTAGNRPFAVDRDGVAVKRGANLTAETRFGGFDVVQLAHGVPPYAVLDRGAVESDLLGIPVRICSLEDLRRMKEGQGRAQDRADLENLPPA